MRSLVGLIPLYAVSTLEPELINKFPSFKRRVEWFIEHKHDVAERNIASMRRRGKDDRLLLALVSKDRLVKILKRMLDETEFLADHGIRSMSKYHEKHPYSMEVNGQTFKVGYVPGDSDSGLFGGNSNWRGPIWLCVNFLLIESLLRFYLFYGDSLQIECPTGSGEYMHLGNVAEEIQHRLQHLFVRNDEGRRAMNGGSDLLDFDEHWKDYLWFFEFFDSDTGRGLGASHQCGWTGLIAKIIHDTGYVYIYLIFCRCHQNTYQLLPESTAVFRRRLALHLAPLPTISMTYSPVQRSLTAPALLASVALPLAVPLEVEAISPQLSTVTHSASAARTSTMAAWLTKPLVTRRTSTSTTTSPMSWRGFAAMDPRALTKTNSRRSWTGLLTDTKQPPLKFITECLSTSADVEHSSPTD